MSAHRYRLADFLSRSTERSFDDTTLCTVLAGLPALSPSGPWLAGGALRRTLSNTEPDSDFDFFFRDADQLAKFKSGLTERGLTEIRETEHHVHFRGRVGDSSLERDIQLIRFAFYTDVEAVIDSFDFTICMVAFDGETLTTGEFALWDIARKRLAINKITYPVSTMRRMLKYGQQGFTACGGCLASILRETVSHPELLTQLNIQYVD